MHVAVRDLSAIRLLTLALCLSAGLSTAAYAAEGEDWEHLYGDGTEAYADGDYALAISLLTQALEVATDDLEIGATYVFLGKAEFATGAPGSGTSGQVYQEKALPLLERAVSEAYDPRVKYWAQWALMKNLVALGFHYSYVKKDEALNVLRRAYDIGQRLRDTRPEDAIEPAISLSGFYARKGAWEEAQVYADEAWAIVQETQLPADSGLRKYVERYRSDLADVRNEYEQLNERLNSSSGSEQ